MVLTRLGPRKQKVHASVFVISQTFLKLASFLREKPLVYDLIVIIDH